MQGRAIGWLSIILGIIVWGLILWVLFAPPGIIALPTAIIGVGSIVATLLVAAALAWTR
jgi:uncharacterized membrane protein YczE